MSDRAVIVRQYRLRPAAWPPEIVAAVARQFRLQREMWNRLVALDRQHRERVAALTAGDADVAAASQAYDALAERRAALVAERKRRRQAARTRLATPEIDAALAALKPEIAAAAEAGKAARQRARAMRQGSADIAALKEELQQAAAARRDLLARRGTAAAPSPAELAAARQAVAALKERLAAALAAEPDTLPALEAARRRAVVAVRQEFAALGLHWGNYNAVAASYERGRQAALKRGAQLRFHGAGDGRLVQQIQGGMTVAALLDGRHGQAGAVPAPELRAPKGLASAHDRRAGWPQMRQLHLRIDGVATATWQMAMHRPIPDDVRVKEVVVTRRQVASRQEWAVTITATRDMPAPVTASGPAVAVDLGWRRLAAGQGLRVAAAAGDDGRLVHAICPERVIERYDSADRLRSRRDELRTAALRWLSAIDWAAAPPALAELGAGLRAQPPAAFSRLARLAILWRTACPEWRPQDAAAIEQWHAADKRLWEFERHTRLAAVRARTDAYRKAAAAIVAGAGVVILEKFDLRQAARLETPAGDETEQAPPMRRYRQIAAPGELRRWIAIQAGKRGIPIRLHHGASNDPHACCGTAHAVPDPLALRRYCPACGSYYDVDENACRVMLATWHASGPAGDEKPGALAAE